LIGISYQRIISTFYWKELAREENRLYYAGLVQAPDVWLWDMVMPRESQSYMFQIVENAALAPAREPSHLTVWLESMSDEPSPTDHHIRERTEVEEKPSGLPRHWKTVSFSTRRSLCWLIVALMDFDSLAEGLVKAEGKGAIAALSPSGLSLNAPAHRYHEALLREILSSRHERLGDAVLAAQEAYAATGSLPELLAIYHLFGDPALRIR
jgi:hypothetical protein